MKPILKHLLLFSGKKLVRVGDLAIGDVIVDSESWEYKDGDNYSGTTQLTEPVRWVIVAKDHFNDLATRGLCDGEHVTVMSDYAVAVYLYSSTSKNFGTSEKRTWLNSVFYNHLSESFRANIRPTTTRNGGDEETDTSYGTTEQNIFLLSQEELGAGAVQSWDGGSNGGEDIGFFTSDASRIKYGYFGSAVFEPQMWYTRSPSTSAHPTFGFLYVKPVAATGSITNIGRNNNRPCVPALNLNADMLVTKV